MKSFLRGISQTPGLASLVERYRQTLLFIALVEMVTFCWVMEPLFLIFERSCLPGGGHPWVSPLEFSVAQLARVERYVREDLASLLESVEPGTPTHEYVAQCLDRFLWDLEVESYRVGKLQEQAFSLTEQFNLEEDYLSFSPRGKFHLFRRFFLGVLTGGVIYVVFRRRMWRLLTYKDPAGSEDPPTRK